MRILHYVGFISALLPGITPVAIAQSSPVNEQLQVPVCLAKHIPGNYPVLAENAVFKIIEVPENALGSIARIADTIGCGRFVNISHRVNEQGSNVVSAKRLVAQLQKPTVKSQLLKNTYEMKHATEVNAAIGQVDSNQLWSTLTHLTSYTNRSATKDTGVQTAQWLKESVEKMAVANGRTDVATYFVATGRYKQPSLVTVIGQSIHAPAVVIGAHMDTLDGTMPGAGDDASGSATVLEAMRVLLSSNNTFNRPIYVMWYAAEERGLVGSQYVVEDFLRKKIPVYAVAQFDMTGYRNNPSDPAMWIYRDYTDSNLNVFLADLIKTYVKVPVKYSQCGYGCSDHASWMEEGIPAAFPCETNFEDHNPYIHTANDTLSLLNTEHLTNFTKLALAFVIELAMG